MVGIVEAAESATEYNSDVTFSDGKRFINSPLDVFYQIEPGNHSPAGMLPREEMILRARFAEICLLTKRLGARSFFYRIFSGAAYKAESALLIAKQREFKRIVVSTPVYVASWRRMISVMNDSTRRMLWSYPYVDAEGQIKL